MSLGPPPWTDEQLRHAYIANFRATRAALSSLPGFVIDRAIEEVRGAVEVFSHCVDDLLEQIRDFKQASNDPSFWMRPARAAFDRREIALRSALFATTSAALSLVDHCRRQLRKHPVEGADDHRKVTFSQEEHDFIQELRNVTTHIHVVTPQWERLYNKEGRTTRLLLLPEQFRDTSEWKARAKSFLADHEKGIDIEELFRGYAQRVTAFYTWLFDRFEETYAPALREYRSYRRKLDAFDAHSFWGAMLSQVVIPRKLDPYDYLRRYLTDSELASVEQLPHRSGEQVDRIIALLDEHGACDERLKGLVHRAFGVVS